MEYFCKDCKHCNKGEWGGLPSDVPSTWICTSPRRKRCLLTGEYMTVKCIDNRSRHSTDGHCSSHGLHFERKELID